MFSSETMEIFDLSMIEKDVESEKKKKRGKLICKIPGSCAFMSEIVDDTKVPSFFLLS